MMSISDIARAVNAGRVKASSLTADVLDDIARRDGAYGCFTRVLAAEAMAAAHAVDARIAAGEAVGPLAGVPFAVKDLFDVAGLVTTAGAAMRLSAAPATRDAEVVARLKHAGAILIGTLNMDEYAYGFATVNAHFGTTRNPHDTTRLAGGSSGGSAAAVAAGMVPLALGSDTNGSIRVPASLCGVWGMRPAKSAPVPLDGVFPFVECLDTVGPFTRSLADLKLAYAVMSGTMPGDETAMPRVARLGGFFERGASPEALAAVDAVMDAMQGNACVELAGAEAARSAAFLITASAGGALHLPTLRERALEYDPAVRDRLLAGAMLKPEVVARARDFADTFRGSVAGALQGHDVLIAPSTPVSAPRISEGTIMIDGKAVSARANLGIYAQAIGLAGPAIVSAPVRMPGLPIGVQFIAAPGREGMLFGLLQHLEDKGVLAVPAVPQGVAA